MLDVIFNSIAGKKSDAVIDAIIEELYGSPYTPAQDKKILSHTMECAANGNYPSIDYYTMFYPDIASNVALKSRGELKVYASKALDQYKFDYAQRKLVSAINDSNSVQELLERVNDIHVDTDVDEEEEESLKPQSYLDVSDYVEGIKSGIAEIDEITNGFRRGTVVTFGGFVGHGKSTIVNSIAYQRVMEGEKCLYISLEMPADILWPMFQARYMIEQGVDATTTDFIQHKLGADAVDKVKELDAKYRADFSNMIIIDEGAKGFNLATLTDREKFNKFVDRYAQMLGGLDFICIDHVGQLELMFPDHGNQILKTVQSFSKTYHDSRGRSPLVMQACQTNREGEKRAARRNGKYDIQAFADLNEVERTSSYLVTMHTSEDSRINNETRICMLKHRFGRLISDPVTINFNPAILKVGSDTTTIDLSSDMASDVFSTSFDSPGDSFSAGGGFGDFGDAF